MSKNQENKDSSWKPKPLNLTPPQGATIISDEREGFLVWQNKKNKFVVAATHFTADPNKRSKEYWEAATENLREDQIEREYHINFDSRGGQKVFPYLTTHPHLFKRPRYRNGTDFKIPKHWPIIAGLDYGGTLNPTAIVIAAVDERNRFHCVDEYYRPSHYTEIAKWLKAHPLYSRIIHIAADPSMFNKNQNSYKNGRAMMRGISDLLEDKGIYNLIRATNDRISGLERLKGLFNQTGAEDSNESYLLLSEDCPHGWDELEKIVYKQESELALQKKNPTEDVVKRDDHFYDSIRYMVMSWDFPAELNYHNKENQFRLDILEQEIEERYDREERGNSLLI